MDMTCTNKSITDANKCKNKKDVKLSHGTIKKTWVYVKITGQQAQTKAYEYEEVIYQHTDLRGALSI